MFLQPFDSPSSLCTLYCSLVSPLMSVAGLSMIKQILCKGLTTVGVSSNSGFRILKLLKSSFMSCYNCAEGK